MPHTEFLHYPAAEAALPSPLAAIEPMPTQHEAYRVLHNEQEARWQGFDSVQQRDDALAVLRREARTVAEQGTTDVLDLTDALETRVLEGAIRLPGHYRPGALLLLCRVAARMEAGAVRAAAARAAAADAMVWVDDEPMAWDEPQAKEAA